MMIAHATKGQTIFAGNTFYPDRYTYEGTATWAELSEGEQVIKREIEHWLTESEQAARTYVVLRRNGRGALRAVSMDVFESCYFESVDAMIEARVASQS